MITRILLNQDGGAGGAGAAAGTPTQDWTAGLGDDVKPLITSKGWKSPGDVVASYRNLEKVLGNNIAKPQPDWDDKKWGEFYAAAGRPEAPDKYEMPDDLLKQSPVEISQDRLKEWQAEFHKHGLSNKQAKALMSTYLQREFAGIKAKEDADKTEMETAELKLRNEWGGKYDANLQAAKAALEKVGPEFAEFLNKSKLGNHPDLIKMFHTISTKIGEDRSRGTGAAVFATTPESAKAEIGALTGNKEFWEALNNRYNPKHAEALERWTNLHRVAYPPEQPKPSA